MTGPRIKKRTEAKKPASMASLLRSFLIGLFIGMGVLGITAFTTVRWTQQNVLDTENWVAFVAPIPRRPQVAEGLSKYLVSQMFDSKEVEDRVAEVLPERASFLAPTLTNQLEEQTRNVTEELVTSETFQTIWVGANRAAHYRVMQIARGEQTIAEEAERSQMFRLDLSQIWERARDRLGLASPILPVQNGLEPLELEADLQMRTDTLQQFVRVADFADAVLPLLVLTSLLTALALAHNRRKVLMIASLGTAFFALLQLIAVKSFRPVVMDRIQDSGYRPAIGQLYDNLTSSLNSSVYLVLAIALAVWIITLMAGSNSFFSWLRKYFRTSQLRRTEYYTYWQEIRMVVASYKPYFWGSFVAIALFWLAFVIEVSWVSVTNTLLAIIAACAYIHILGSPPYIVRGKR